MTREKIIEKVQLCLDEVNGLSEGRTMLDPQIEGQLDSSAVSLLMLLPSFLCGPVSATPAVSNNILTLPSDFLKLGRVRLNTWDNYINIPLPESHPRMAYENYSVLKAHAGNPLAVIKTKDGGKSLYVAPTGELEEFTYVKRPSAAEVLPDDIIDMLSWHTAERIYRTHGEVQLAQVCRLHLDELVQNAQKP